MVRTAEGLTADGLTADAAAADVAMADVAMADGVISAEVPVSGATAVAGSDRWENTIGHTSAADTPSIASPITKVMSMSTASVTVTTDDPDGRGPRRSRRWRFVALWVLSVGLGVALFVPTPYYLFEPGSARATQRLIEVEGERSYRSRGQVMFTTVSIERATLGTLVRAWLDDAIEVEREEEVYPEGRDHDQIVNQAEMDESKLTAIKEALEYVGYSVALTGHGAFIDQVIYGFPSAQELHQGDVITAVNGTEVQLASDLPTALGTQPVGTVVQVTVESGRSHESRTVSIALGENSEDTSRGYLGVRVSTYRQGIRTPFEVEIDSGKVTGPSAGLAWTLGLIDRLTPGDLTDGRRVAVTGTIQADGTVGPIGGIEQKMSAVKRQGIRVFIVPAATPKRELDSIRRISDGEVRIVPVDTLADAVKYLAPDGLESPASVH